MSSRHARSSGPPADGAAGKRDSADSLSGFKRGHQRYHSRQRRQGHHAAEALEYAPPEIPAHGLICPDEPRLIVTQGELEEFLGHLAATGSFAFDTEFIGELSYLPKLCVVQLATPERVAIVDPLAPIDLSPLWDLVASPEIETVVHAGEQDLEPVARLLGRPAWNIFDTQIAAGFCRLPYPLSLRETVRVLVGVRLGKGATFSQWDRRPLTPAQQRYAADDVRFLPAIRAELGKRLQAAGREGWCLQACREMSESAYRPPEPLVLALRVRGAKEMRGRALATLAELAVLRDRSAREHDVPARSLIPDKALASLARRPPRTKADLASAVGLPHPVRAALGEHILEAVRRAQSLKADELPVVAPTGETAAERVRIDSLWSALQSWCWGNSIDPALVSSRQDFAQWCLADKAGRNNSPLVRGWRGELLQGFLGQFFLGGHGRLELSWSADRLEAAARGAKTDAPATDQDG